MASSNVVPDMPPHVAAACGQILDEGPYTIDWVAKYNFNLAYIATYKSGMHLRELIKDDTVQPGDIFKFKIMQQQNWGVMRIPQDGHSSFSVVSMVPKAGTQALHYTGFDHITKKLVKA
ncbi:MAG: hypothetical protein Q9218_003319 [Villophora microphyllina]